MTQNALEMPQNKLEETYVSGYIDLGYASKSPIEGQASFASKKRMLSTQKCCLT